MEQDLTTGSVFKRIVYFSLPYLLSYFLQTLYGMADLFITGQFYGVDTITAVSNGSQIMHMMTVIIVGLAMGTTVTIGHSVGAKCMEQAEKIIVIGNGVDKNGYPLIEQFAKQINAEIAGTRRAAKDRCRCR